MPHKPLLVKVSCVKGGTHSLFQLEQKHQIHATWFMPTRFLQGPREGYRLFSWNQEMRWVGMDTTMTIGSLSNRLPINASRY